MFNFFLSEAQKTKRLLQKLLKHLEDLEEIGRRILSEIEDTTSEDLLTLKKAELQLNSNTKAQVLETFNLLRKTDLDPWVENDDDWKLTKPTNCPGRVFKSKKSLVKLSFHDILILKSWLFDHVRNIDKAAIKPFMKTVIKKQYVAKQTAKVTAEAKEILDTDDLGDLTLYDIILCTAIESHKARNSIRIQIDIDKYSNLKTEHLEHIAEKYNIDIILKEPT